MRKSTGCALSVIFLLVGVIFGFMLSPAKNGFGNNVHYHTGK